MTSEMKIRYSQYSPEYIGMEIENRYIVGKVNKCKLVSNGINDVYEINTENNNYFFRMSVGKRVSNVDVKEEINVINLLLKEGLSVVIPIADIEGNYVWTVEAPEGVRTCVLFKEAVNKSGDWKECMINFGCLVAKMHQIADTNNLSFSRKSIDLRELCDMPLIKIKKIINPKYFSLLDEVSMAAKEMCSYIENLISREKPYYGFCHGDLHIDNVFFNGETPILFDFDCMGIGFRSYDISVFLWNTCYKQNNFEKCQDWSYFLEGYNSIRVLSQSEIDAIPAFIVLRTIWFMGLHVDCMDTNKDGCWMDDEYFMANFQLIKLFYLNTAEQSSAEGFLTQKLDKIPLDMIK